MSAPRVAIYTAIYGKYEATAKPLPHDLPCPAFLLTDSPPLADQARELGWGGFVIAPPDFEVDPANGDPAITRPMLEHKYWKTHPIEAMRATSSTYRGTGDNDVEASIWLDGNMQIKGRGQAFVDRCMTALGEDDWSIMRHPFRDCIYTEAEYTATVCAYRYDAAAIRRQAALYEQPPWSHPRGWGLPATGYMVRRHSQVTKVAGEAWWALNLRHSHQDQISLPVVLREFAAAEPGPALRFNYNLPWGELWDLHPHGS